MSTQEPCLKEEDKIIISSDSEKILNILLKIMHVIARKRPERISRWDVSDVTNMSSMFRYCEIFDKPLNQWNVSKVTNMSEMFIDAKRFNQPLHRWDTSKVKKYVLYVCLLLSI